MLKIGDWVKVIDENEEGIVIDILNAKTVIVDCNDFEYKYQQSQLVKIDVHPIELKKVYDENVKSQINIKPDDKPKPKNKTTAEKIEELGRVRGKRNSKKILEFDLHIHDLLVRHDHMTPGEMLNYQLDYCVNCLEQAIKKNEPTVIFIHGIGKGVLKVELHKIFRSYGFDYHDGFMQEYGYGATRVELG